MLTFYQPNGCAIHEAGRKMVGSPEGCAEKVVPGAKGPTEKKHAY